MQVLQSSMDGSQTNNHLPTAMATLGYSEVSKYFLSYLRCVFMEHAHLSSLYKCSRHWRPRGHIQPQSSRKNFDWIWYHVQMQGKGAENHRPEAGPFCTYARFQLSAMNLRWAGFRVAGRVLQFVLWTVPALFFRGKKTPLQIRGGGE